MAAQKAALERPVIPIAYVNGNYLPLEDARISVLDRGFLFADGIYEISTVLDGKLIDNDSHLARLQRSLGEIQLALPVSVTALEAIQRELIRRNGLAEGIVYIEITRGAAEREFYFPQGATPTLVLFTQSKAIVDTPAARHGIKVKSVPDLRWARRDIKSVALLAQVLAKEAARADGCDEAWMTEMDGTVTEGASSSASIITSNGQIVTRPLSTAILPGCTRKALLALAEQHKVQIDERPFTLAEALNATEAFITSASSFVTPVIAIDGKRIGVGLPGPTSKRLREIYIEFARRSAT